MEVYCTCRPVSKLFLPLTHDFTQSSWSSSGRCHIIAKACQLVKNVNGNLNLPQPMA